MINPPKSVETKVIHARIRIVGVIDNIYAVVLYMAGNLLWRRARYFGILPFLTLAFFVFVFFKHGFIMSDRHVFGSVGELLLVALACVGMEAKGGAE